jgi:hypothetical protein
VTTADGDSDDAPDPDSDASDRDSDAPEADRDTSKADSDTSNVDSETGSDALHRPDPATARRRVATAIDRAEMVTVFGRCTVEYEGRAASTLGPGERLVMLKPDGTVLVHTDEGQKPVNWQPPGCTHEPSVTNGERTSSTAATEPTTPTSSESVET